MSNFKSLQKYQTIPRPLQEIPIIENLLYPQMISSAFFISTNKQNLAKLLHFCNFSPQFVYIPFVLIALFISKCDYKHNQTTTTTKKTILQTFENCFTEYYAKKEKKLWKLFFSLYSSKSSPRSSINSWSDMVSSNAHKSESDPEIDGSENSIISENDSSDGQDYFKTQEDDTPYRRVRDIHGTSSSSSSPLALDDTSGSSSMSIPSSMSHGTILNPSQNPWLTPSPLTISSNNQIQSQSEVSNVQLYHIASSGNVERYFREDEIDEEE